MESSAFPASFYRVTIKGMYVRDGKVLLVRAADTCSGEWQLPGGGLDFGEDVRTGFEREVAEEMGLRVSKMSTSPMYVWSHRYDNKRGLDWYYAFVVAYRVEFSDLHFTPSRECEEIGFFSKDEMRSLKFEGQLKEFPDIFNPEDFTGDF